MRAGKARSRSRRGENAPPEELQRKMHRDMWRIRRFEERALYESTQGNVHGTLHLCIGQEACCVGVCSALNDADYVASTHRGHGHCIAKGARTDRMMAELFGRVDGYCRGKGGSMHIAALSLGMLGANGIVGAGLGIAAGAALSCQRAGKKGVAVAFFGDGAASRGVFHEVLNLASLWRLPVVFVCENNGYAQWVPQSVNLAIDRVAAMAASYRIPGYTIDGNNVFEVHSATRAAVERARAGEGPTLLELTTYRIHGHSTSDMNVYRTKEEIGLWRQPDRDPILRLEARMKEAGMLTDDDVGSTLEEIDLEMNEAVRFAHDSPYPDRSELLTDVMQGWN